VKPAGKHKLKLETGTRLGKYRLCKRLGTGGSCEVWQARDAVEGIWVALKIPLNDVNGRRKNDLLLREIRAVSKLRHPNILSVKNADIIKGYAVLATELSARTLDDCSKPMSVRFITSIILQVLEGLAYAHKNKIVHCDVTPSNIFLFQNRRAALGDFGIAVKRKGRIKTIDDFGTPGYVAPEQAYGYPTYKSDCFAVAIILYEYLTGVLPKWPFTWTKIGESRLTKKISKSYALFIKRALSVDTKKRFQNAEKMLIALNEALPKSLKKVLQPDSEIKEPDWRKLRRIDFKKKYGKIFQNLYRCIDCDQLIDESMLICPNCGSAKNRFDTLARYDYICPDCHRGILPEWRFCPWCYGTGFRSPHKHKTKGIRYHSHCRYCGGKLMRFMRYCPWCHRKVKQTWHVKPFPEVCSKCSWPVDTEFFSYCPWCKQRLLT
jgi:serine/threonine protein kinase